MTSESTTAYSWIWLPHETDPVPAGRLDRDGDVLLFTYGRSYLERSNAISLYLPELPLRAGPQVPLVGVVAGCIRDAAPDGWGQRVIENSLAGQGASERGLLTYLLHSGSNRIGALDFQLSARDYSPRDQSKATLGELLDSAARVEAGDPLSPEFDRALLHGTSVGGARPKATVVDGHRQLIAKFSSTTDTSPMVQIEYLGMELARRCGLNTATVELVEVLGKQVLLVERFDRPGGGTRLAMVSALTVLGLDELGARYASYADLADQIRARFTSPTATLRELFARITFNILIGNTDDHARNHAAFWDGDMLTLTPAYDVCPYPRSGGEANQIMAIDRVGSRRSQVTACVAAADVYHLEPDEAHAIIDSQIDTIHTNWEEVCDLARMTTIDRKQLWRTAVLNPYSTYDYRT
jgi:serine/threonine-protein kinase HipA